MAIVGRLSGIGTFLAYDFDEISQTKATISGVGTSFAFEYDENVTTSLTGSTRMRHLPGVGIGTTVVVFDSINEVDPIETAIDTTGLQLYIDPGISTSVSQTVAVGQSSFTTAGSFIFTVPNGITSISAVVVGGGGGGSGCDGGQIRNETNNGGGGGGLAYGTFDVTPGETLTVVVGAGGNAGGDDTSGTAGGDTTIVRSGTTLLSGGGGAGGQYRSDGATSDGGASGGTARIGGGSGGSSGTGTGVSGATGGGGAGGYSGAGGAGGNRTSAGSASTGAGGGGGGGYNAGSDTLRAGGGGGVGILGSGANGTGGTGGTGGGGGGGSSGTSGGGNTSGLGGTYGGGGGGKADAITATGTATPNGGAGTNGAVRIIWGTGRSYPSTSVADATVVNYALTLSDLSGNGRTASSVNGAYWVSSNSGVVAYDGTNDYMTHSAYKGITGTGARTTIIWFKALVPDVAYRLFGWGTTAAGGKWNISLDATTFRPRVEIATGSVLANTSAPNVADCKWHMVAASAPASGTANNIKLYIDGDLITDTTITSGATAINTVSGSDVSHGASLADGVPGYLNGHTSQFLIYNTQLSDFQIKQIYRIILNRF
jgi:hypothetical protein